VALRCKLLYYICQVGRLSGELGSDLQSFFGVNRQRLSFIRLARTAFTAR